MSTEFSPSSLTRRAFLEQGTLFLAGVATAPLWLCRLPNQTPVAKIGLITDIHHADKVASGTRHYRQAMPKLTKSLADLKKRKVDQIICLGDIVDDYPRHEEEEAAIKAVADAFKATGVPYHFIMGNHCLAAVDKARYAELTGTPGTHSFFDSGGIRFVCLDACYRSDGVSYAKGNFQWTDTFIPKVQIDWLKSSIASAPGPCVVLTHQLLDPMPDLCVKNHAEVRETLKTKKVSAVIQGHHHKNRLTILNDTPYVVLRSIIDGEPIDQSGYSVLEVYAEGSARLSGFAEQATYGWPARR